MSADKLEKLANTKFDFKVAKANRLEKLDGQLTFAYAGGLFKASHELLAAIHSYRHQNYEEIVLLDLYDNPVRISEVDLFEKMTADSLQTWLNDYLFDFQELKKVRKGEQL